MSTVGEMTIPDLQESVERQRGKITLGGLLREVMEGRERGTRWKNLKERLGLKGMNCCGATWGFRPSNMSAGEDDEHDEYYYIDHQLHERAEVTVGEDQLQAPENSVVDVDPACVGQNPAGSGMNLATALAAERHFRAAQDSEGRNMVVAPTGTATVTATATATVAAGVGTNAVPGTPLRASLMRLLMEADGVDEEREKGGGGTGMDAMCCVCMGRRKGAAFIPCGHTFCRVCSRELWLNRGSCPLCNRSILEILDIF